jgi:hypothetical protein
MPERIRTIRYPWPMARPAFSRPANTAEFLHAEREVRAACLQIAYDAFPNTIPNDWPPTLFVTVISGTISNPNRS